MTESIEVQCLSEISNLIKEATCVVSRFQTSLDKVEASHRTSAENLLHYCEIRKTDLSLLQQKLGLLGLSRLTRAEEHVVPSLQQIESVLKRINYIDTGQLDSSTSMCFESLLENHSSRTLGPVPDNRRARIMVTIPSSAANNERLIKEMIKSGMNVARINCAFDGEPVWLNMIRTIRKVSEELQQHVKIIMDLAGPKARTHIQGDAPEVIKLKPVKNGQGKVITPKRVFLNTHSNEIEHNMIPAQLFIDADKLDGKSVWLRDARGKKRKLNLKLENGSIYASIWKTTYLETGQKLSLKGVVGAVGEIGKLPKIEPSINVSKGDLLSLYKSHKDSELACTLPEAIDATKVTNEVYFDDGKIGGNVISKHPEKVVIKITDVPKPNTKLKDGKGINFPDTNLSNLGLQAKDRADLDFVCKHADGVHVSFISGPSDVSEVIRVLKENNVDDSFGLILKIENRAAFNNMKRILLTALQWKTLGVTIARGDLAIETGWNNISRIQKEIIKMSNAAHIPVIWATQVLDQLAKNGSPSRSEVTDAASSIRADCVMLNKGPHIIKAIKFLDRLLSDTELFQKKNVALLPKLMELH